MLRTALRKKEKLAAGERELEFSKCQVLQTNHLMTPCEKAVVVLSTLEMRKLRLIKLSQLPGNTASVRKDSRFLLNLLSSDAAWQGLIRKRSWRMKRRKNKSVDDNNSKMG